MPCWYYDKKELFNTPSIQDGIDYKTECQYRKEGALFIINMGKQMGLGYNTVATSVVYFHRFYMFHSFKTFPIYVTACCSLFLAGKVEETPKKCRDIIKTAKELLTDEIFKTFGDDPKEEVMTMERILLQTIKFDLQVEHPYGYLKKYAKCLKVSENKLNKIVQSAWNFINDSLCTTLSVQWEPEIIAVAFMYLSAKINKFKIVDWIGKEPHHTEWWDMFVEDITKDLIEDICHQVLDLYSTSKTSEALVESLSKKPIKEKITPSTSNGMTSTNLPKTESAPVFTNGCAPADVLDSAKPIEPASHFPPYSSNFTPENMSFPPAFPPINISVPPPPINHMGPPPMHMNVGGSMRPLSTPGPSIPQSFHHPYPYPPNSNYFPNGTSAPPPNLQRNYYMH